MLVIHCFLECHCMCIYMYMYCMCVCLCVHRVMLLLPGQTQLAASSSLRLGGQQGRGRGRRGRRRGWRLQTCTTCGTPLSGEPCSASPNSTAALRYCMYSIYTVGTALRYCMYSIYMYMHVHCRNCIEVLHVQ